MSIRHKNCFNSDAVADLRREVDLSRRDERETLYRGAKEGIRNDRKE